MSGTVGPRTDRPMLMQWQVTAGDTVAIFGGKELEVGLGAIGIDRMFLAHKRSHSFYLGTDAR